MRAGNLRHRIQIQQPVMIQDDYGSPVETWQTICEVWASILPLRGQELFQAQQWQSKISHKVTIRYRSGISPRYRVLFGDRVFEVETVINVTELNRDVQMLCSEVLS